MSERKKRLWSLIFCAPWLVGLTGFTLIPAVMSLYFSLCDYSVLASPVFIGLGNYTDLMKDSFFWVSLRNTVIFAAIALPLGTVTSLALALLLNARIFGKGIFRVIFFVPSLVPLVALGMLWQYLLNPEYGLLEGVLNAVGIEGPNWLGDPRWTKPALALVGLWGVGHAVIIYLAGLEAVSKSLYEAAMLDGANRWQQLWAVTLPSISPVIYFNVVMGLIGVLQIFALPYVMLGPNGDPARSSLFFSMYIFNQAFIYLRMGYASAMAWVMFGIIVGLTLAAHRLMARHVHYGN